jgi:hypothetical protein
MKKLCQCIGLASLILVLNYGDLLGGGYDVRMHVPFALGGIVLAQILDILILGTLIFAVVAALARTRVRRWARLAMAILIPPILLVRTRAELPFAVSNPLLLAASALWAAFVLLLLRRFKDGYRRLMHVGDAFGIFLAVFAVCSLAQLAWVARWKPGPHQHTAAWSTTPQPPRQHPRLIWIVFDELSYDQLYAHRAPGLALPNFDALSAQSTVFTNAQPIGDKTVKVLPSLLSGSIVEGYRFSFDNRLTVRSAGAPGYHPLTGTDTLFADAQRHGWRTASTGWYNPYCTLFASAIDDCYWTDLDKLDGPMAQNSSVNSDRSMDPDGPTAPAATLGQNTWQPLKQAALELVAPARAARDLCDYDVRQRYLTHIDLERHALKLLNDDQADFVFLHLPIPHSPTIWSRATNTYTQQCGGSYLDGLALADRELGRILTTLQNSPRWSQTTVIVNGDHSWRSYLWKNEPAWTAEDTLASRAGFDPRPALILHRPNQTHPQQDPTPTSLLHLHTLIEQTLHTPPS